MRDLNDLFERLAGSRRLLLLLYLLYAKKGEPIKGVLWLQGEMFVIWRALNTDDRYYSINYLKSLLNDIDYLINLNLVEGNMEGIYRITQKGKMLVDYLIEKNIIYKLLGRKTLDIIEDVKNLLNDLGRDELLGYIYFNYPESIEKSEEFKRIEREKVRITIQLFKKGKISLERTSEILDIPIEELIRMIKRL